MKNGEIASRHGRRAPGRRRRRRVPGRPRVPEHAGGRSHPPRPRAHAADPPQRVLPGPRRDGRRHGRLRLRRRRGGRHRSRHGRLPPQRAGGIRFGRRPGREPPGAQGEGHRRSAGQRQRLHLQRPPGGQSAAVHRRLGRRPEGLPAGIAADQSRPPVARPDALREPGRSDAFGLRGPEPQPLLSRASEGVPDRARGLRDHGDHPPGEGRPRHRSPRIGARIPRHQRHRLPRRERRARGPGPDVAPVRRARVPPGGLAAEPARPEPPGMGRRGRDQGRPDRNAEPGPGTVEGADDARARRRRARTRPISRRPGSGGSSSLTTKRARPSGAGSPAIWRPSGPSCRAWPSSNRRRPSRSRVCPTGGGSPKRASVPSCASRCRRARSRPAAISPRARPSASPCRRSCSRRAR